MALLKTVATDFGIDATYWHIFAIDHNRAQRGCHVVLAGYADAAVRAAGHRPLATVRLECEGDAYPGTPDGLSYEAVYRTIRVQADRSDAPPPFALFAQAADA